MTHDTAHTDGANLIVTIDTEQSAARFIELLRLIAAPWLAEGRTVTMSGRVVIIGGGLPTPRMGGAEDTPPQE